MHDYIWWCFHVSTTIDREASVGVIEHETRTWHTSYSLYPALLSPCKLWQSPSINRPLTITQVVHLPFFQKKKPTSNTFLLHQIINTHDLFQLISASSAWHVVYNAGGQQCCWHSHNKQPDVRASINIYNYWLHPSIIHSSMHVSVNFISDHTCTHHHCWSSYPIQNDYRRRSSRPMIWPTCNIMQDLISEPPIN